MANVAELMKLSFYNRFPSAKCLYTYMNRILVLTGKKQEEYFLVSI